MVQTVSSIQSKIPEMDAISDASDDEAGLNEDSKTMPEDSTISALNSLSELLEHPENFLHTILLPQSKGETVDRASSEECDLLRSTSKVLFSRLEKLASMMEMVENKRKDVEVDEGEDESPLSGLPELFTGETNDSDDNEGLVVDAETIWGQVDIQNMALFSKVSKSIRKLSKRTKNTDADGDYQIRLLNMSNIDDEDDVESERELGEANESELDSDVDVDDDDDEDAKRIRERMERSMAAMDDSEEEDIVSEDNDDKDLEEANDDDDDVIDPSREEMNDGFFDLHEMEAFADEEEELLPDEAFGEPEADTEQVSLSKKKDLPHIRGREGNDGEEDDEEFDELEVRMESSGRRKKYRDDEDINALATLYDSGAGTDKDDDDDVVNMTAASIFGQPRKPSKEYLNTLKKKKITQPSHTNNNDSDADSWDNHDFESTGENWRSHEQGEKKDDEENENDDDSAAEDDEEENDNESEDEKKPMAIEQKKSAYSERTEKLSALTEDLEKEILAEKPWRMMGETSSKKRPENSLLENTPEFEFATKMAPIITQEHTTSIEEMVKQRIIAEDWDDVIPRELPDIGFDKRNGELPEVSQEKSKLSLGELYEREYLKKATGYDKDKVEKETEEEKARSEMKMLFANLCSKLDALSNYHFAPRPVADEAVVKTSSTPAVAMEEVLPLHVSDANALAPEEIYGKKKGREGILRGDSEMDQVSPRHCFYLAFNYIFLS